MPVINEDQIDAFIEVMSGEEEDFGRKTLNLDDRHFELLRIPKKYKGDMTWKKAPSSGKREMECTWFYYFGRRVGGDFAFHQYHLPGSMRPSDEVLKNWIFDAQGRARDATDDGVDKIIWEDRPGHVIICVDIDNWRILENKAGNNRSLYFSEIHDEKGKVLANRNHSFFDLDSIEIVDDSGKNHKLIWVKNHHFFAPKDIGVDPKYQHRKGIGAAADDSYKFDIYLLAPIKKRTLSEKQKYMVLVLDPGGRNTGP